MKKALLALAALTVLPLYQLELQRLQHELNLAKAALRGANTSNASDWNNE